MAAFATPAELASHLQVPEVDTATATLVLDGVSGSIRDECGWTVTQETVTAKALDSYGRQSLWLPTRRLTAVAAVVENGVTLVDDTHYRWWENGRLERLLTCWPDKPRSVVVTYTHGHASAPHAVRLVCLVAAGEFYNNPGRLRSKTVGGVSWTAADLTKSQRLDLEAYRLDAAA